MVAWGGIEPPTQGFSILCTLKHASGPNRNPWEYFRHPAWLVLDFSGASFPLIQLFLAMKLPMQSHQPLRDALGVDPHIAHRGGAYANMLVPNVES